MKAAPVPRTVNVVDDQQRVYDLVASAVQALDRLTDRRYADDTDFLTAMDDKLTIIMALHQLNPYAADEPRDGSR